AEEPARRRACLVAGAGQQAAPGAVAGLVGVAGGARPLLPFPPGDVDEGDGRPRGLSAGVADGPGAEEGVEHGAVAADQLELDGAPRRAGGGGEDIPGGGGQEVVPGPAEHGFPRVAEPAKGGVVDAGEPALGVEGHQAAGGLLEEALGAAGLAAEVVG